MKSIEDYKLEYSIKGIDLSEEASIRFESLSSKEQGDIEYLYKQMLMEQGYDVNTADNTTDGREDFLIERFLEI